MASTQTELRKDLAQLRLDRSTAATGSRRHWWIGAVVVLLAAAGIAWKTRGRAAVTVETAKPVVIAAQGGGTAFVPVLSGSGYVVSAERYVAVGVRVPGRIERYFVEEGDRVQAGDPLVQLDARDYDAAVRRAEAQLAAANANAVLRDKQLIRTRALAKRGVVSKDELDVKVAEADAARAAGAQARADLDQARVALEYTTLRAPTSGVILAKLKEVGEIAVPGGFSGSGDLIRIANLVDLRGQVDITEGELSKIRLDQRAEVLPDAYPDRRYDAKVVKLYPQVDRQKGTLRVEVQIARPDEFLWPDMSARITFMNPAAAQTGRAVMVPRNAVQRDGERATIHTVADGRVRVVPITLGADFGEQVQVTSGLGGDEVLIVGDRSGLHDGDPVAAPGPH